ncbi:serine protease hepsin [Culex quinquefasciatus]|uniref:Serine protease hepsin n=1 Tax=Culex quinquefasciatus TaxID=7176 RepID=B0W9M7_CULQU|nr:serine protease hepsin [Culex quinquefasciatus]|eukprot:XP_001845411.1 serine protease hepsin [Culex quinquefasciatus]
MDILSLVMLAIFGLASSVNASEDSISSATQSRYTCGIRKNYVVDLIHKGHSAVRGQWPWHAALFQGKVYKCGGTLIDQRHVLTSAHCVVVQRNRRPLAAGDVTIQLGKLDLDDDKDYVQIMNVSEIRIHEEFGTHINDIALLVLSSSVVYSDYVIPICIESIQTAKANDLEGRRGWTVGWGETEGGKLSKVLKTAQMPVVNNTVCVQSDSQLYGRFISDKVFCAGDQNGTSVCRGDSGGGMYSLAGDQWELRGIVSFAGYKSETASCDTMRYVVFTNVASYYHWIKWKTGALVDENASAPKRKSERSEYRAG